MASTVLNYLIKNGVKSDTVKLLLEEAMTVSVLAPKSTRIEQCLLTKSIVLETESKITRKYASICVKCQSIKQKGGQYVGRELIARCVARESTA